MSSGRCRTVKDYALVLLVNGIEGTEALGTSVAVFRGQSAVRFRGRTRRRRFGGVRTNGLPQERRQARAALRIGQNVGNEIL